MISLRKGFTLAELMVVVAIIAFLAMVAVPSCMRFFAKAKRTEAYVNLHSMYGAQKAYWAEHGRYTDVLSGPGGIGWQPEGYSHGGSNERFYYTYGFGHGAEGRNFFTGNLLTEQTHLSGSYADEKGFLMFAAGDIDGDGEPDILSIDHFNKITIVKDDLV